MDEVTTIGNLGNIGSKKLLYVGVALGLVLLIGISYWLWRRAKKKKAAQAEMTDTSNEQEQASEAADAAEEQKHLPADVQYQEARMQQTLQALQ